VQEQLGVFFKQPGTRAPGAQPEHAFPEQQRRLLAWLGGDLAADAAADAAAAERVPARVPALVPELVADYPGAADRAPDVAVPLSRPGGDRAPADRPAVLAALPAADGAPAAPPIVAPAA
jgi:hypothetical protein